MQALKSSQPLPQTRRHDHDRSGQAGHGNGDQEGGKVEASNDLGHEEGEEGEEAGIAHRMRDGSMVYAPETMATE